MASREYFRSRQAERRQQLVILLGGKCVKCGTTENLDFDHVDPTSVSFRLSGWGFNYSWERILKEAEKCQLLCKECHRKKTITDLYSATACAVSGKGYSSCPCDSCRIKRNENTREAKREWKRRQASRGM